MKPFLVALSIPWALLVGCMGDHEHDGHSGHHGATLPSDAYYVGIPLPFRTVADCVTGGKLAAACTHAVALCASGAYGLRHGDLVTTGRYRLEDHHAVDGDHGGATAARFDFDVEAGQLVLDPDGSTALAWDPDYEGEWKTSAGSVIDCAARPPKR